MAVEKQKALEIALSQIEKQFGKGAVMKLGDAAARISVSTIPTGCLELDYALGVGGVPRGRIVEIYGPESSGARPRLRSTSSPRLRSWGASAAFIDAEHALDPSMPPPWAWMWTTSTYPSPTRGSRRWRLPNL